MASSKPPAVSQPVVLPPILSETRPADGFRSQMWGARALKAGEQVSLQQALIALEARTAPAEPNMVLWHVGKLLNHWPSAQSAAEKEMIVSDWLEDLAPYSEAHIVEACGIWRRTQKFKPHVADIVQLIERAKYRDQENARRAKVLLGLSTPRPWEHLPAPREVLVDRPAAGMLASITKRLTAPAARKNQQPPPARDALMADRDPEAVAKLHAIRKPPENKA